MKEGVVILDDKHDKVIFANYEAEKRLKVKKGERFNVLFDGSAASFENKQVDMKVPAFALVKNLDPLSMDYDGFLRDLDRAGPGLNLLDIINI